MMKYKYNKNKTQPSAEEINKHKDFGKLVTPYEEAQKRMHRPLYKDPKAFLALLLLLLILYLLTMKNSPKEEQPMDPKAPIEQKP